jgi:hypothetical protein
MRQHPSLAPIRPLALVLLVALTLAPLAACKKPAPAPAPAAAVQPVTVVAVDLGRAIGADKKVAEPIDTFAPADTIYASVATEGSAASATLSARWSFEDGQVVNQSSETIAPTGPATTEFHIAKPDGWPPGTYQVEISLDGTPAMTKSFKVQ